MRLLPSLRGRKRYLAFRLLPDDADSITPVKNSPSQASMAKPLMPRPAGGDINASYRGALSRRDLTFELDRSSQSLLGDAGSSECDIRVLSFDGTEGIVSCVHREATRTRAVLATIYEIRNRRVSVRVIGVSGTVKGAKRFFSDKR
ncbi:MAG: Rpp14/Pop5 family protein [Euryarchaeota archaeon]|nr:Rpp14/Pop5 family protein [Euryarchaeota archaeon]